MEGEIWLPVPEFEGLYEVSNLGRVRSLKRLIADKNGKRTRIFKERILKNVCAQTGYHFVSLHNNSERQKRRTVHRLVLAAFNPHPDQEKLIVDHLNGDRADNRVENLRWTSYETNNRNTPYVRYLQTLLEDNKITFIDESSYAS